MHSLHNTRRAQTHREATVCYSSDCKSECDVNMCWSGCDRLRVRWTSTDYSIKLNTNTNGGGSSNRRNNNATAFTLRETHTRSFVRSVVLYVFDCCCCCCCFVQRGNVITFFQLEVFAQQVFSSADFNWDFQMYSCLLWSSALSSIAKIKSRLHTCIHT